MESHVRAVKQSSVLKTPEQRQEYRRSLYKAGENSPAWKDTYRKRCMARLRESRNKFLSRFRPPAASQSCDKGAETVVRETIQSVMMEEWEELRGEVWETDPTEGYLDHVIGIMDELREELIREEQSILAQYERENRFDEDALCAAIQSLTTNEIICPICQKNVLHQNHQVIFCACGLRIDTAQDGITLDFVRNQLEECSSEHSSFCLGQPVFSLETIAGMSNIIMNCPLCEYMVIII